MPRVLVSYVTPKGTISRAEKMWLNGEKKNQLQQPWKSGLNSQVPPLFINGFLNKKIHFSKAGIQDCTSDKLKPS
jgi:hypothetical protein